MSGGASPFISDGRVLSDTLRTLSGQCPEVRNSALPPRAGTRHGFQLITEPRRRNLSSHIYNSPSEGPVSRHSGSHELPSVLAQIAIQSDMSVQGDGLDRQRSHTASGYRSRMRARTSAPGRRAPCSTAECGRAKARRDRRMLDDTRTRLPCGASGCSVVSADTFLLYMILIYGEKPSYEA